MIEGFRKPSFVSHGSDARKCEDKIRNRQERLHAVCQYGEEKMPDTYRCVVGGEGYGEMGPILNAYGFDLQTVSIAGLKL